MTDHETAADSPILAVLAAFADDGWTANHSAEPRAKIRCGNCDEVSAAGRWSVMARHRAEGASDPADMQAVYGVVCPACDARGALLLSYGPAATEQDQEVLLALREQETSGAGGVGDPLAADSG